MKNIAIIIVLMVGFTNLLKAQAPSWSVNSSNYTYGMTMVAEVSVNCGTLLDSSNLLAAFVGAECRGVVSTSNVIAGKYLAYLTIRSNTVIGDTITFKIYDANLDSVCDASISVVFEDGVNHGLPSMPFMVGTNYSPTDMDITNQSIPEGLMIGDTIGSLSAIDNNIPNVFTYSLSTGVMDNDNYLISGNYLTVNTGLSFVLNPIDTVTINVTDAGGCDYSEVFIITISDSIYGPIANTDSYVIDEDQDSLLNVLLNDLDLDDDLDTSSIQILTPPLLGTAIIDTNGMIFYSPNANIYGNDTIIYSICDMSTPTPLCDTAIVVITILEVDDAPIAVDDNVSTIEDIAVSFFVLDNDYDYDNNIDTTSLTIISAPTNGIYLVGANGEITYTPNQFYTGTDTLQYNICDLTSPSPLCDTATVVFTVIAVPNPPFAANDTTSTLEDIAVNVSVLLNDFDPENDIDSGSVSPILGPFHGSVTIDTLGVITYTPNLDYNGTDSLSYSICDLTITGVLCDTAMVYFTIIPVADAPVANNDSITSPEDVQVSIDVLLNDTDPENNIDVNSLTIVSGSVNGTASVVLGAITYTPNPFFNGSDTIVYQVCDLTSPLQLCDTAVVYLTIEPVSNSPIDIIIDTLFVTENNPISIRVSDMQTVDNDLIDSFTYELVMGSGDEDNNQFSIIDSTLYIETKTNFNIKQTYNFRVMVKDAYALSYEKEFVLNVIDIEGNDPPLPSTNFISPNGDGKNDYWEVENVEIYAEFELTILDQFGFVLYSVDKEYDNTWDGSYNGEPLRTGNYYYLFTRDNIIYKGNITIVND